MKVGVRESGAERGEVIACMCGVMCVWRSDAGGPRGGMVRIISRVSPHSNGANLMLPGTHCNYDPTCIPPLAIVSITGKPTLSFASTFLPASMYFLTVCGYTHSSE